MTETITQPFCGFIGETVRTDRNIVDLHHNVTPRHAETERHVAAMADDPVLAKQWAFTRGCRNSTIRSFGIMGEHECATAIVGECMGDAVTEGEMLIAEPARPVASEQLALVRVRGPGE